MFFRGDGEQIDSGHLDPFVIDRPEANGMVIKGKKEKVAARLEAINSLQQFDRAEPNQGRLLFPRTPQEIDFGWAARACGTRKNSVLGCYGTSTQPLLP